MFCFFSLLATMYRSHPLPGPPQFLVETQSGQRFTGKTKKRAHISTYIISLRH